MNKANSSPVHNADIIIIGAGVIGCSVARRLSRYNLNILLLEAADDVASGASKANSGIVHGGYTAKAGTLKGELSIRGNRMFDQLEEELAFGFKRTGSLVLAFDKKDIFTLEKLVDNGKQNGVEGLEILSPEEALSRCPSLNTDLLGALYCPETGIVSPYEFTIALAENAVHNGVSLHLDTKVISIEKKDSLFYVDSGASVFSAPLIINAAGASSGDVAAMAGADNFTIHPRKGQYLLFRRGSAESVETVIFQPPTEMGKGILVTPTVWGNLLVGPDAREVNDPGDLGTDPESLAAVFKTALRSVPGLDASKVIRIFSGIRPTGDRGDFIIEESSVSGFINLGGIESPGLTSSPAIALKIEDILKTRGLILREKQNYDPVRKAICRPGPLADPRDITENIKLEYGNPDRMVCRCEQVPERVILDALNRGLPIRSLDAVKRRTRAGMGPCQGQFCGSRVKEYLQNECGLDDSTIIGHSRDRQEMKRILDEMRSLLKE
ncbi:MAG: NAD(P)/FAD-dependent oxidoreductase [Spirochaetales bacterium]|nr:NAD(P)/FAD-dependent oxidoreductase [Spirochaetales bacterium]